MIRYRVAVKKLSDKRLSRMPNFLDQIQALNTSTPQPTRPQLEPRQSRRQKARDAAKSAKKAA